MPKPIENLRKVRLEKLDKLRGLGVDPYPAGWEKLEARSRIQEAKNSLLVQTGQQAGEVVVVAGRVMGLRAHGSLIFADLRDETGQIQVSFQQENFDPKQWKVIDLLDRGDFLGAKGKLYQTKAGELTIEAVEFKLLAKSVRPLPSKHFGLEDAETRYRKRYLDLIVNPKVRQVFEKRSRVIRELRKFLDKRGFLEVETPTLQPVYGGGFARPFVVHHNALEADFYLRISDEMYLKRLVVGGFEKVYEIAKVFRNEGLDRNHNPEFTMFEAMIAYQDYWYGMDLIEEIVGFVVDQVFKTRQFAYQGHRLDFSWPWKRYQLVESVQKLAGVDPAKWTSVEEAQKAVSQIGVSDEKLRALQRLHTLGEITAFVFEEIVEEKLVQPTIIYDYPVEVSPLAKKAADARFVQRFEVFAGGVELGNNYTELSDPLDLKKRFVEEKKREKAGFQEAHQTDDDYLEAVEYGLPPTCGVALGIDRLVMLLTGASNIKEVIPFPTLRPI